MLNNDNILGIIEVKTPSPLSSSADRSINEDEEPQPKSGSSSSDSSSLSDLRERLSHFSSPNRTPQLSSRLSNIGRRFPQKRATNIIEEDEEREQPPSSGSVEEKGARARRRARLRAMVATKPTETTVQNSKSTSTDNQTSNRSSMIENRSPQPDEQCSFTETFTARTFPSLTPYRKRNDPDSYTSRSLRNPLFCQNSPTSRVDLQPLSPISLDRVRPKRFGGYRPQAGVILQNLSSGSEAEYNHETVFVQKIDHLMPVQPSLSSYRLPPLSSRSSGPPRSEILRGSNDRSTPLSSSRTIHDPGLYRSMGSSRSWWDTFGGKVELESPLARNNVEEHGNLECEVENLKSTEETRRSEGCMNFSKWKEVTVTSSLNTPPEDRPKEDKEAEDGVVDKQFTNVPTLALNSQEMSNVATPAARVSSEPHLDADALIAALSNVSLNQQTSANVYSEYSSENNCPTSRSRLNESEMSYGSTLSKRSKIPVRIPTYRSNPNEPVCQDVSSSPEGLRSYSERSDQCPESMSGECQVESARTQGTVSPASDWFTNENNRDRNERLESENSNGTSPGQTKKVCSDDCITSLQIASDDEEPEEAKSDTYRIHSNDLRDSCESLLQPETTVENPKEVDQKVNDDLWERYLEDQKSAITLKRLEEKRTTREDTIGDVAETLPDSSSSEDPDEVHQNKVRFSVEKLAAEELRKSIYPEQTNTITFFVDKMYKTAQHSSTSKLHQGYEKTRVSPRFRKSQDRFPFTISEKTSVSSVRFKHPGRSGLDKKSSDRSYHLDHHPSITRLAGSGFEETTADIIDYVTRSEKADQEIKSYGMKGLVQRVSARLRRSKKKDKVNPDTTSVIYQNRDYKEEHDSLAASCSESSLLKELRMYEGMREPKGAGPDSPDEKSIVVSDKKSPERPCKRRYDRDDLWVRTIEKHEPEEQKNTEERKSATDYSVFFVKSPKECTSTDETKRPISAEKRDRVKFRGSLTVVPKMSHEDVPDSNRKFEDVERNRNIGNGCFCLQFYRMIVPVSLRHRLRYNRPLVKKKSRFRLQTMKR